MPFETSRTRQKDREMFPCAPRPLCDQERSEILQSPGSLRCLARKAAPPPSSQAISDPVNTRMIRPPYRRGLGSSRTGTMIRSSASCLGIESASTMQSVGDVAAFKPRLRIRFASYRFVVGHQSGVYSLRVQSSYARCRFRDVHRPNQRQRGTLVITSSVDPMIHR